VVQGPINTLDQNPTLKRLFEKTDSSTGERTLPYSCIRKSCYEDDRRAPIFGRQSALQFKPVNAWHLNVWRRLCVSQRRHSAMFGTDAKAIRRFIRIYP
jgi:hypothetical protein